MPTKTEQRSYWLDLFTGTTWQEFLDAGANVSGFSEKRWKTVQKMKRGDYLLCYLTGLSRWIGVLEIISEPYKDNKPIWKNDSYPARVQVKIVASLSPETGVPIHDLRDQLSIFENLDNPNRWTGYFRGSPSPWKAEDGEAVVRAISDATQNPTVKPVDPAKLNRKPAKTLGTKSIGPVTIPDSEERPSQDTISPKEETPHTEIQWLLLKLGNDMGLDVWVARNDKGKSYSGKQFINLPRMRSELPLQFDEATNRTIELIDVLWLNKNSIVAAFEIESTTSIHSGLLRMSDLIAMQPNLNIPLYIVAPEERREKVFMEINRPTFSRLSPKLNEICRYITFESLRERLLQIEPMIRYIKPEFLDELSESCDIEES